MIIGKLKQTLVLFSLALGVVLATPAPAQACRDCPFPIKLSQGRWLMPNGAVELQIEEYPCQTGAYRDVRVTLRDTKTGLVVAVGEIRQRATRKTVTLDLVDNQGRVVHGAIRFWDEGRDRIQAKFTCENCAILHLL